MRDIINMENKRLLSIDIFRGLTVILMTIVNNPGDWGHIYAPLEHAEWHGYTLTDLVFPSFLFIVGISTVLSKPSEDQLWKIFKRALRIFLLGLSLSFFSKIHAGDFTLVVRLLAMAAATVAFLGDYSLKKQFWVAVGAFVLMIGLCFSGLTDFEHVRIPGVLQRIAVVYLLVGLLHFYASLRIQIVVFIASLVGYWALMHFVEVPGIGAANLEVNKNLAAWLDNYLLEGHLWASSKTWDPEGILSTLPAVATGLAGLFAGRYLQGSAKASVLFAAGAIALAVGTIWGWYFPINKALWTSSYVLVAAGWDLLLLAVLQATIRSDHYWKPVLIFGMNPMLVFFFSGIIPRVLGMIKIGEDGLTSWIYSQGIEPLFADKINASLAGALIYVVIWAGILAFFDSRKRYYKV
ncbi:acyltransferase family protein [Aquirufa novilacunae]|jgi:predicted acyltransferase|uniref:Heparan-alpha-glucosaminide N-acetyltransferase domain-containing protein n=1 Tax=Aquirufa novilacunae TaxID=3139305 RepID=A0ABW8U4R9_9BACT